ncbi:ATP-binding cassette sub-family G member 1-like [Leptopilina heterotoma]|uniref:ATP-binding cassette sub-family G member 1-like n=1 Tax=Leptopilina heterotoma TaxID=63436 RepID=UPI001CA7D4DA|nr:ATP-binding cassette sub-family G member 1-like [Leptopilina heterotoma]XP_043471349.1 ATP-binding cassette sub-family G member 1-like [Leptopilina heterotoma]
MNHDVLSSTAIDINFQKISCSFKENFLREKKCVLQEVSGNFKCGQLTAIMGPSGAGKSTLLNILTGFQRNFEGRLIYQSEKGEISYKHFKKYSRYIQQDDALYSFFTVRETITIAAELKLESSMSRSVKRKIIDDILSSLDLMKTKDTICGKLSGGERKRFSIALEMLNDPLVMFLDEPTTGLDSSAAMQCATVLKNLAKNSRTIVCTIHQPSTTIYEMFDHVYMVAGGRCIYQGDPMMIVSYFSSFGLTCPKYHNPADYAMEVMCNEYGDFNRKLSVGQNSEMKMQTWRKKQEEKIEGLKKGNVVRTMNPPSEFNKTRVLLFRCFLRFYKDWQSTMIRFFMYFLLGVLFGMTYYDCGFNAEKFPSNIGMFTLIGIIVFYCSLLPAVLKLPFELSILRKENLNDWYKIRSYYVVFVITNLIFQAGFVALFTGLAYVLSKQPMELFRFLMFVTIMILFAFIGESIGLILGIIFKPVAGIFGCIVVGSSQLSFCGYFIYYNHMSPFVYELCQFVFTRYVSEGVLNSVYRYDREKLDCPSDVIYCHFRDPTIFLREIGLDEPKFITDATVLASHAAFFFIVGYILLKKKVSSI